MKQQYPFEGFNIDDEGPTELMSSFLQWINEGLYKHHSKKREKDDHYLANCLDLEFKQLNFVVAFPKKKDWFYVMSQPNKCWTDESYFKYRYTTTNCFFKTYIANATVLEYENKIVETIKGFGIPGGLPWHLTDEVYVPLSTLLPKYLESIRFFYQNGRTNWSVLETYQVKNKYHPLEVIHVTGISQQASNSLDCEFFFTAYAEFLCDGLQVPYDGISSENLHMRYVSLLWNYGILKAWSGYVSNNEDPQRPRPKKAKFNEYVVKKAQGLATKTNNVRKKKKKMKRTGRKASKQARTKKKKKRNTAGGGEKNLLFPLLVQLAGGFPPVLVSTKIG
ncbi:hypothetical protein H5410_033221 [Solanum commersonii]|uniref:Ulp1 protease family, C-terminal catalytic domain containing protein n=1 Tax=Solanum commersonii TaxID=4109 RepID=A0A9J5YM64_SOLCO|nr:hypothetical protein H5410_033221 [Solanum commersonii]